jgi:lipoate-protein ligase A
MTKSDAAASGASPGSAGTWRLILSGPSDGARNMAVDDAIMRARAEGLAPPTLRLYRWQPPAVSLGRFQALDERVDVQAIRRRGYGLVRRPTGGRAILHSDELTYSVVVCESDIEGGAALMTSYREISRGIEAGLSYLGIDAALGPKRDDGSPREAALPTICFAKAARCDLVAKGRKVVGSAQTRSRGVILQHGSIPLSIDLDDLLAVLPGPRDQTLEERRRKVARAAVGVAELVGRPVTFDELCGAVRLGFACALGVTLQEAPLLHEEEAWAEELATAKYAAAEWTYRPAPRS